MATISDVSRIAGVSKATVSRVINGTGQVKESTRLLVRQVMSELDYKPSSVAQALATKSGNSVGLVLSDFTGSYFGILLKQASVSADLMGKQLLIADGHNHAESELKAVHSLVEKKSDVIVLYSRQLSPDQIIALNQSIDIPLVNVGRELPQEAGYSIAFDQKHAVEMAVDHLVQLGHRSMMYLGPEPITPTSISRLAGFKDAISHRAELGISTQFSTSEFGYIEGYQAGKKIVASGILPTAMVIASDDIAIGCIKAFTESGIQIPRDISIVSIDNDPCSPFVTPSLTTVDVPIQEVMAQAMLVAQQLVERKGAFESEIMRGQLIIRDSTQAASP
ncbi:LacI family DNA-binding transcriptional regulator [Photobacterium sanguinicancri]|uniref:LacI family transcriptional regulator n=1 Tax=Photobacterium sanguinicancri TaxID=875932 RepID=A0ABX4FZT4_9GAMM|nr:LacI family DNA-binding transcriptional regulator [Photobacterium sanguinicancri]OZS43345.1 LacI family transcriptional regulator [Photobacterium sanguinicancri]